MMPCDCTTHCSHPGAQNCQRQVENIITGVLPIVNVESKRDLWEILVPCNWNDGQPVRTRHHQEWDRRVREITGGLTILKPGIGQWQYDGKLYQDRVIPVRLHCTMEDMGRIAKITIAHYEQLAVMFYRISTECHIQEATDEQQEKFVR